MGTDDADDAADAPASAWCELVVATVDWERGVPTQLRSLLRVIVDRGVADVAVLQSEDDWSTHLVEDRDPERHATITDLCRRDTPVALVSDDEVRANLMTITGQIEIGSETFHLTLGRATSDGSPFTGADRAALDDLCQTTAEHVNAALAGAAEERAARRLQHALLPDHLDAHPHLDVAAIYRAAAQHVDIGGDWYDTFAWSDGRYCIVVGDVVGHGVEAAAAMGRIRAGTELLLDEAVDDPVAVLDAIERATLGFTITDYLTVAALIIDPATRELAYATAGHPPPLLVRHDGSSARLESARSGPLCGHLSGDRSWASTDVDDGDLVLVYTDGLIERRDGGLDQRLDDLEVSVRSHRTDEVHDLVRTVADHADLRGDDDTVVMAVRLDSTRRRFATEVAGEITEVAAVRGPFAGWLEACGLPASRIERVVLATHEAMVNAAEHGAGDGERSQVVLRCSWSPSDGAVRVEVSDTGSWREHAVPSSTRGRGLTMIDQLTAMSSVSLDAPGTTVRMHFDTGPGTA
ncbi:MAG: SpoIIE family protein phosphatase [Actinomycetota bacterium]